MEVDLKILQELVSDEKKPKYSEDSFRISRGAFEMIKLYSKLCSKIAGDDLECYGYLLMPKDSLDGTVTNIYFADDQTVNSAHVRISEEAVYNASKTLEPMGYHIVGWWHSHGSLSTFHSGTDRTNFETICHSVAPRTMYRTKEVVFLADEARGEIHFDNYKIKNVDVKSFAGGKPVVLRKEESEPYAFSLVVNQFGEYYLERLKKSYDEKGKKYELRQPSFPALEVVDKDKDGDLEFFISGIEKDIHQKIRFPRHGKNFSEACPDWENSNGLSQEQAEEKTAANNYPPQNYADLATSFLTAARGYFEAGGEPKRAATLARFIVSAPEKYRYDILKESKLEARKNEEIEAATKELEENKDDLISRVLSTTDEIDPKSYLNNRIKLDINGQRSLINLMFMQDFSNAYRKYSLAGHGGKEIGEFVKEGDDIIRRYSFKAVKLAEAFSEAAVATRALTYYAMEVHSDYGQKKSHRYRNLANRILNNISGERYSSFANSAAVEIGFGTRKNKTRDFFLYPERYNIVNQLTRDLYELKTRTEGKAKDQAKAELKSLSISSFLTGFPQAYNTEKAGEQSVDRFIEENLLSHFSKAPNFSHLRDLEPTLHDYTKEDLPKRAVRAKSGFTPTYSRRRLMEDDESSVEIDDKWINARTAPVKPSNGNRKGQRQVIEEIEDSTQVPIIVLPPRRASIREILRGLNSRISSRLERFFID